MHASHASRRIFAPLASALIMLGLWPVQALGDALVRFVHAVPGAGAARLQLSQDGRTTDLGLASFAQSSAYGNVRSGRLVWKLIAAGKVLASGIATIGNGAYTILVLAKGPAVGVGIYRDRAGVPGTSLLRMIHAAPELGAPTLELGQRAVATGVAYSQATSYMTVKPGTYELSAIKPGSATPLVARAGVPLSAGRASTAIIVGSRGQRTRIITLIDRGAPTTTASTSTSPPPRTRSHSRPDATVTVHRGDSLWSIARAQLEGDPSNARILAEVQRLWARNGRRIGSQDPNVIIPGQRLGLG